MHTPPGRDLDPEDADPPETPDSGSGSGSGSDSQAVASLAVSPAPASGPPDSDTDTASVSDVQNDDDTPARDDPDVDSLAEPSPREPELSPESEEAKQ
jgi:hypothetical protein